MRHERVATAIGPNCKSRLAAAIIVALGAPAAIHAQEAGSELEEIVVTGSRLRTSGMDLPSPVTVVTRDEISIIAPTNLIEGMAELPQFYGSNTTQNPGNFFVTEGAGSLNLRGLQSKRTLQLLNGRRVVQSTIFGGPDVNLFPETVISSVETVTGGASAAYGTDAVAGAVNFILDTDFEGFRANVSGGENDKGQGDHYEVSFGAGFALGDNTHVLVSLEKQRPGSDLGRAGRSTTTGTGPARLLENTAAGAGTTQDNPALRSLRPDSQHELLARRHPAFAARGGRLANSRCERQPFTVRFGQSLQHPWLLHGERRLWRGQRDPRLARSARRRAGRTSSPISSTGSADGLTVFGQLISGETEVTSPGNPGLFPQSPGRGCGPGIYDLQRQSVPPCQHPAGDDRQQSRVGTVQPYRCARGHRFRCLYDADHRDGFSDGRFQVRLPRGWLLRQRRVAAQRLLPNR